NSNIAHLIYWKQQCPSVLSTLLNSSTLHFHADQLSYHHHPYLKTKFQSGARQISERGERNYRINQKKNCSKNEEKIP
ncbi:hypothetical protein L9F63_015315, partial [Diploptera punctata]